MTTEERKILTCQNCDEINDPGMLFCIHCGKGLTASAEKIRSNTTAMGGKCPACGQQDELNMRFCIFCSSPMVLDQTGQRPVNKFSWEMELADNGQPKAVTSAALKFKDAVQKSPTKKNINYLPIGLAAGATLGFLALLPFAQDLVKRTYLSGAWPKKSLTVYTKHPFAEVTIYEPSDAKVFTLAETDAKGAVRFNNLEPGDYNIKITGKDLRTAFQQINIDGDNPAVIGYGDDKVVELDRIPTDTTHEAPHEAVHVSAPEAARESAHEAAPKPEESLSPAGMTPVEGGQKPIPEIIPLTEKEKLDAKRDHGSTNTTGSKPSETTEFKSMESKSTDPTESKRASSSESQSADKTESKRTGNPEPKTTGTKESKSSNKESNPAEKL